MSDSLEVLTIAFFLHGTDVIALIHSSAWAFSLFSENSSRDRAQRYIHQLGRYQLMQFIVANCKYRVAKWSFESHCELARLIADDTNDFNTGLLIACRCGFLELAKLTLACGAICVNNGLYCACENRHLELARLMLAHGANRAILNIFPKICQEIYFSLDFSLDFSDERREFRGFCELRN